MYVQIIAWNYFSRIQNVVLASAHRHVWSKEVQDFVKSLSAFISYFSCQISNAILDDNVANLSVGFGHFFEVIAFSWGLTVFNNCNILGAELIIAFIIMIVTLFITIYNIIH